jgi:hypothetical protein
MAILTDGLHTEIIVGLPSPGILFIEKRLKPPGYDFGGKIDTTGLRNNRMRTSWTKQLATNTDMTAVVEYDPQVKNQIISIGGRINLFGLNYPDGEVEDFWGSLDKWEPSEHVEGDQPTSNVTVICHGVNDSGIETVPVVLLP